MPFVSQESSLFPYQQLNQDKLVPLDEREHVASAEILRIKPAINPYISYYGSAAGDIIKTIPGIMFGCQLSAGMKCSLDAAGVVIYNQLSRERENICVRIGKRFITDPGRLLQVTFIFLTLFPV